MIIFSFTGINELIIKPVVLNKHFNGTSAAFRAPQHPQLRGAQTLEGAAREWEKIRLELKRAIPGYATDVFVMLELKTKLLFCFFQFRLLVYEKLQFTPC